MQSPHESIHYCIMLLHSCWISSINEYILNSSYLIYSCSSILVAVFAKETARGIFFLHSIPSSCDCLLLDFGGSSPSPSEQTQRRFHFQRNTQNIEEYKWNTLYLIYRNNSFMFSNRCSYVVVLDRQMQWRVVCHQVQYLTKRQRRSNCVAVEYAHILIFSRSMQCIQVLTIGDFIDVYHRAFLPRSLPMVTQFWITRSTKIHKV